MNEPDPREELATLTAALRAHLELCGLSGAAGLPAASPELAESRGGLADLGAVDAPASAARPAAVRAATAAGADAGARAAASSGGDARAAVATGAPSGGDARAAAGGGASPHFQVSAASPASPRLQVLATEVAGCTRCRLHETRTQTVFARGSGESGLCFVGEGPGADEDAQGVPFVGKAGQLLDRMIEAMGFTRDEVYVCNIVKCRPPKNRKPEPDEMASCSPFLTEQLELIEPKVIVAMGATAVQGLLGLGGIMRLRGTWKLYKGKVPVMPTFHPAYLLRTPEAKREVWQDLQEVLRHMGRTVPARK